MPHWGKSVATPGLAEPLVAVTGSQRPYIFDLPNLLSLPQGFEYRFRYRHCWVSPSIVRDLGAGKKDYVGRQMLVLFHSQESSRLIPIRAGTILGIEAIGPMTFVRFRVGDFFKVD